MSGISVRGYVSMCYFDVWYCVITCGAKVRVLVKVWPYVVAMVMVSVTMITVLYSRHGCDLSLNPATMGNRTGVASTTAGI